MKVIKYLGFNRAFADSKGLCGVEFTLRYRLSEGSITLLTINASTFERYQQISKVRIFSMLSFITISSHLIGVAK